MAATVGATLTGVTFPLRHSGIGPFISSAGNVYVFGRDSVNTGTVKPMKTVAGGASPSFDIAVAADNQSARRLHSVYPPSAGALVRSTIELRTRKTRIGGNYTDDVTLLRFDTSSLPDGATTTAATLQITPYQIINADARSLVGEWYQWDGTSATDWTNAVGTTAFSVPLSSLTNFAANTITLSNLSSVSPTGYTYLRIGLSGGQPTGENEVGISELGTGAAARLSLTYTTPPNPMASFTAQTAKQMSSATTTAIEAMSCYQVGDVIHVATQIATGAVYYNSYNMATDTWSLTTSETAAAAAAFAPVAANTFVGLSVRSTGQVVIVFCGGVTVMSGTFHSVRATRRTGVNTWQQITANTAGSTIIDNGGSVNWLNGVAALGASDRVHFFFRDHTNLDSYQRTATAASPNALQTFPAAYFASESTSANLHRQPKAVTYNDTSAGTLRVRTISLAQSTLAQNLAKMDSTSDAPTVTTETVSGATPAASSSQSAHDIAYDPNNGDLHLLYASAADSDLYRDVSASGGGAWGTDVSELAGTISQLSANIYTRAATRYVALVVNDAGTLKYAEIDITPVAPPGGAPPTDRIGAVGIAG